MPFPLSGIYFPTSDLVYSLSPLGKKFCKTVTPDPEISYMNTKNTEREGERVCVCESSIVFPKKQILKMEICLQKVFWGCFQDQTLCGLMKTDLGKQNGMQLQGPDNPQKELWSWDGSSESFHFDVSNVSFYSPTTSSH